MPTNCPDTCDKICLEHSSLCTRIDALEEKVTDQSEMIESIKESLVSINSTLIQVRTAVLAFLAFLVAHQFGALNMLAKIFGAK